MLDQRAQTLLKTLIERYIADGQPVGSRTLSRYSGLDLSPATIRNAMADLEALGGSAFVDELIATFTDEAARALRALGAAVANEDVTAFRNHAHALRSGAANVGALRVYRMCLDWREIDARELAVEGERHLRDLEREFSEVRAAIAQRDGPASGSEERSSDEPAAKRRA